MHIHTHTLQDKSADREVLLHIRNQLADKPETLFLKAIMPQQEASGATTLTLQERPKDPALASLVDTYITNTAGTPAEKAGIPRLVAAMVEAEFERLSAGATGAVNAVQDTDTAASGA